LKTEDEEEITKFLDIPGHNLWLISPSYIYEQYGTVYRSTSSTDFAREYLHIVGCKGNVTERNSNGDITARGTPNPLVGVDDTLASEKTGGVSYATYETEPPLLFDDIGGYIEGTSEDPTEQIFYQNPIDRNTYNAVSYAGDEQDNQYKVVYFSFNFYLIDDPTDCSDIVDKVLTFFGLMGGVEMELIGPSTQWVNPSEEVSYQFKVINTGKKTDTMTLSTEVSSKTTASQADWPSYRIEVGGKTTDNVDVPGTSSSKNYKDNIYLIVTAPEWDKDSAKFETEYTFKVTAVSEKTGNESYVPVRAKINLYSEVTVWYTPQNYKEIDVGGNWECYINIKNSTNGADTYDVSLKIEGEGKDLAYLVVPEGGTPKTTQVSLTPNTARQVIVKIKAGDNELAGYHNISVEVKGVTPPEVHGKIDIQTKVKQFYEVNITSESETRIVIDPNDVVGDNITETFTLNVFNWGNGYESVHFTVESHDEYEIEDEWLDWAVISFDGDELDTEVDGGVLTTLNPVTVEPYDESNDPMEGEEEIMLTVNIPVDVEHGEYWFNVMVESEIGLIDEENPENNNLTIMIKVIKPDLTFSLKDLNGTTYDDEPTRVIDNYRFIDDLYEEPIPWDDFDEVYLITLNHKTDRDEEQGTYGKEITFSIEIVINNIGDSVANLEAVLQTIVINVTHEEEDEFGDFIIIDDATLYPVTPTEAEIYPGQNATITFETFIVEWLDPKAETEIIYTFTVTIDDEDFIMEQDEANNQDSFELSVIHEKKPKKGGGGSPGFEL
jgi:hypothetical protein